MEKILSKITKAYFIGIGGVGMSGIALLLKERGIEVAGSDQNYSATVKNLQENNIKVFLGHAAKNIDIDVNIICYSSAIKENNPEIIEAKKRGINVLNRGELLAKLCEDKKMVAIAGSHGKTTTTALLSYLLINLGHNPTVFLGGQSLNYSRGAWWGDDVFVSETDESDGSFLYYRPWISIITNIDKEHLEHYGNMENLKNSFMKFARQTKKKVIGWGDQPFIKNILSEVDGISFGWEDHNLVVGKNFRFDGMYSCFDLHIKGEFIDEVKTPLLGEHNCLNTLAVFAYFLHIGEDLVKVNKALKYFKGTKRRFQINGTYENITFVDDYAHHPTEIKAVLKAAKLLNPKRLFVIFQPHRFSRIKSLKDCFSGCFSEADELVITDIYSASEENIEFIDPLYIYKIITKNIKNNVSYVSKDKLAQDIPLVLKKGDLVLALGAGDINIVMREVISEFKKYRIKARC